MRKPRDFDAELKALEEKARQLKDRKLHQLGELVIATGADALPVELLAGALLGAVNNNDLVTKEEWRKRGAAFFHGTRGNGTDVRRDTHRASADKNGASPAAGPSSA